MANNVLFKTSLIKGPQGDRGEAGEADSVPTDGVLLYDGVNTPEGYEETETPSVIGDLIDTVDTLEGTVAQNTSDISALSGNVTTNTQAISALSDGVDDNAQDIQTQKARIDQIVALPSGSTQGDAELADIRIGFDGKTYTAAGDAVRAGDELLQDEIKGNIFYDAEYLTYNGFYVSTYNNTPSVQSASGYSIKLLGVQPGEKIFYDTYSGTWCPQVVFFNDNFTATGIYPSGTYGSLPSGYNRHVITIPANTRYIAINSTNNSETTFIKTNLPSKKAAADNKVVRSGLCIDRNRAEASASGYKVTRVAGKQGERISINCSQSQYTTAFYFKKTDGTTIGNFLAQSTLATSGRIELVFPFDGMFIINSGNIEEPEIYRLFDDDQAYIDYINKLDNYTEKTVYEFQNKIMNYAGNMQDVSGYNCSMYFGKQGQKIIIKNGSYKQYFPLYVVFNANNSMTTYEGGNEAVSATEDVVFEFPADNYILYVNHNNPNIQIFVENGEFGNYVIVDKNGRGNLSTFKEATEYTWYHPFVTVQFNAGEYDLVEEYGSTYLDNISDNYTHKHDRGPECGNYAKYIFSNNAKLVFNYTGSNNNAVEFFAPVNIVSSCDFENLNIECSNCRYCVHEDIPTVMVYAPDNVRVNYNNSIMKHNGNTLGTYRTIACIGAGASPYSTSQINGGKFEAATNSDLSISYHHPSYSGNKPATVNVKNAYIKGKLKTSKYPSDATGIITFNVCGCSLSSAIETDDVTDLTAFNNEVRE